MLSSALKLIACSLVLRLVLELDLVFGRLVVVHVCL